jgi:quinoprotein glucose dehydrogenase
VNATSREARPFRARSWGAIVLGVLLGLIGLWLAIGGAWLLSLGGSPYYVLAGLGCLASAVLYLTGRSGAAAVIYILVFAGTCVWAVAEVGGAFWLLLPRVAGPAVFAILVLLHALARRAEARKRLDCSWPH